MTIESISEVSIEKVSIPNWKERKEKLMKLVPESHFLNESQGTYSDFHYTVEQRNRNGKHPYADEFFDTIDWHPREEFHGDCICSDLWCMRYGVEGKIHVHDHTLGMSGILYADFDPIHHEATTFISPMRTIWDGSTVSYTPEVEEGDLILFPSQLSHYIARPNFCTKERLIFSFNIRVNGHVG